MQRLSPDARSIVQVLRNVAGVSGYVGVDHTQVLFDKRRDWQAAVAELVKGGFITTNEKGELALTPAAASLT